MGIVKRYCFYDSNYIMITDSLCQDSCISSALVQSK